MYVKRGEKLFSDIERTKYSNRSFFAVYIYLILILVSFKDKEVLLLEATTFSTSCTITSAATLVKLAITGLQT